MFSAGPWTNYLSSPGLDVFICKMSWINRPLRIFPSLKVHVHFRYLKSKISF